VCLVGHSTGGLDIRRLLLDLAKLKDDEPIVVDGEATVKPRTIRESIRRVVFLSAPHRGTNIADWVQAEWPWRKALIEKLRAAVAGSQYLLVEPIESLIAGGAAALSGAGLLWAVQDSLDEADEHIGDQSPVRRMRTKRLLNSHSICVIWLPISTPLTISQRVDRGSATSSARHTLTIRTAKKSWRNCARRTLHSCRTRRLADGRTGSILANPRRRWS